MPKEHTAEGVFYRFQISSSGLPAVRLAKRAMNTAGMMHSKKNVLKIPENPKAAYKPGMTSWESDVVIRHPACNTASPVLRILVGKDSDV